MNPLRKFTAVLPGTAWLVLAVIVLIALAIVLPAGRKREFAKNKDITAFQAESERTAGYELGDARKLEANAKPAAPTMRKVIVTHDITVEIKDLEAAFRAAIDLAKANGGYTTETSRVRNDDGSFLGRIVMRVPPGAASGLLEKLRAFGAVTSENSTGEDITDQYIDMEARLRNMRASEVRLRELLTRQTKKLADVLAVEQELTRVRGEIESFEAQKRTWDTLTALVTIRVELVEPKGALPALSRVWHPIRTAFGAALEGFSESLHTLIVFVGTILPWSVFFCVPVYLYFRFRGKTVVR